ncbi:homeobox protein Hox-C12a [Heptranchias perlo]|uniref:homeobox protein Hox-C12a n=1 Tax=Heptranchias perlo TaxID=212740 RepID=UPI0035599C68
MGDHNLLNPGFVGPLVNIHTGDAFYFPNFRASGGQLAGLPSLSYPRRDNVCSLPWTSADPPCNGYPQSYLGGAVSINPPFNRTCDIGRAEEQGKSYYREAVSESAKREERSRDAAPSAPHDSGLSNAFAKYGGFPGAEAAAAAAAPRDHGGCQPLESDSGSPLLTDGGRNSGSSSTIASPVAQVNGLPGGGTPWYPLHSRTRKKRKPYSKVQIAELEGEFMMNEFITRQRRRELSDRLNLSDQQVKIWFQNRRMKKKRLLMREQALTFF